MEFFSNNFEDGGELLERFTCNGEGARPSLSWSGIPEGAKSLAISLVDPDAPGGNFVHWIVVDIPPDASQFSGNESIGRSLKNTTGESNYVSPCPPSGKHRYIFTLYALDVEKLTADEERDFFYRVQPHVINQVKLTGFYGKE